MALQNRVTPLSEIIAHPGRGLFFGNRGCLHGADGRIRRSWRGQLWITCLTEFKGRRRALLQPGRYTELFFLDEAVAFGAGHRPCAECRRADYLRFRAAWAQAGLPQAPRAADIDRILHRARLAPDHPVKPLADLPDGAFVNVGGQAWLVLKGTLLHYDAGGYDQRHPCPPQAAPVLTPAPFVHILSAGYQPILHPSAL